VGLPDGEEIMRLSSFWHNTGSWQTDERMDRRTDRHVTIAKIRASG